MAMHVVLVRDKLLLCGATEIWGCLFLQQSLALPDWHTLSHLQGTHLLRAKGWVNTAPYPCLVGRPWEGSVMASWNGPGEAELPSCRCGVCSMPGHWQGLQLAEGSLPSLLGLSGPGRATWSLGTPGVPPVRTPLEPGTSTKAPAAAGRLEGHLCHTDPGASASASSEASEGLAGRDTAC